MKLSKIMLAAVFALLISVPFAAQNASTAQSQPSAGDSKSPSSWIGLFVNPKNNQTPEHSLYLLCWDYERIKYILPFKRSNAEIPPANKKPLSSKFPFAFFGGVFVTAALVIIINIFIFEIRPGNSLEECTNGCAGSKDPKAACGFCDCIYNQGKTLDTCLKKYKQAKEREKNNSPDTTINK